MCSPQISQSRASGVVHAFVDNATFRLYETPITPARRQNLQRLYGKRLSARIAAFWAEGAALALEIDARITPMEDRARAH